MSIDIPTSHRANIALPYGELKNIIGWCENNCSNDWRFTESESEQSDTNDAQKYDFFFESERDYVAFLVWKK